MKHGSHIFKTSNVICQIQKGISEWSTLPLNASAAPQDPSNWLFISFFSFCESPIANKNNHYFLNSLFFLTLNWHLPPFNLHSLDPVSPTKSLCNNFTSQWSKDLQNRSGSLEVLFETKHSINLSPKTVKPSLFWWLVLLYLQK